MIPCWFLLHQQHLASLPLSGFLCISPLCVQPCLGALGCWVLLQEKQLHLLWDAGSCQTWPCTAPGAGLGPCPSSALPGEKGGWGYTHIPAQAD